MFERRATTLATVLVLVAALTTGCRGAGAPAATATATAGAGAAQPNADGTITDPDGFVRFPGEASRRDQTHYYLVEDLCGQFTKTFMEGLTRKTFVRVAKSDVAAATECDYYLTTKAQGGKDDYLMLNLGFLNVADQKTGLLALGRAVTNDPSIPMDNWIVRAEDGHLVSIYFLLGTDKFLILDRSSATLAEGDLLAFAVRLGEKMRDFR